MPRLLKTFFYLINIRVKVPNPFIATYKKTLRYFINNGAINSAIIALYRELANRSLAIGIPR